MSFDLISQPLRDNQRTALEAALQSVKQSTAIPDRAAGRFLTNQCASSEWEQLMSLIEHYQCAEGAKAPMMLEVVGSTLRRLPLEGQLKLMRSYEIRAWLKSVQVNANSVDSFTQTLIAHAWVALARATESGLPPLTSRLSIAPNGTLMLPGLQAHLRGKLPGPGSSVSLRIDECGAALLDGRVNLTVETLRAWALDPPVGTEPVGKGIDLVFDPCLNDTRIRLYSAETMTTNRTRQENLLVESVGILKEAWPDIHGALIELTDAIEFLDDPLRTVVSNENSPGKMQLGTFAHDPLVAATGLSHEIAHLYLYEKTRLGQIDDSSNKQVFSPWKQCERPAYLTLHALTTYLTQSLFLARYTLSREIVLPYVQATLGREIKRLQLGARAFAESVGTDISPQTQSILEAVESFTDEARKAY